MKDKKIKKETAVPKVYSILIKTNKGSFLWHEVAYSLENAFLQAKKILKKKHSDVDFDGSSISLFYHSTLDEVVARSEDIEILKVAPVKPTETEEEVRRKTVSAIMKKIIENKDIELFEAHIIRVSFQRQR